MKNLRYGIALSALIAFYNSPANAWGTAKDAIYEAAHNGDVRTIENLLSRGYSIDTPDGYGMSALCSAYRDGDTRAYNLLLRYGANSYAECMYVTSYDPAPKTASGLSAHSMTPYYVSGALLLAGGIAAVAAGGGGGGGDSGGGDTPSGGDNNGGSNNNSGNNGGSNNDDNGGSTNTDPQPIQTLNRVRSFYTEDDYKIAHQIEFLFKTEFQFNTIEVNESSYVKPLNYLGAINVLPAYTRFTGTDENGDFTDNLNTVYVGVLDTGVWGNHKEFELPDGYSKVSGYNFDYGPCRNGDKKNCYAVVKKGAGNLWEAITSWFTGSTIKSVFYDNNGTMHEIGTVNSEEELEKLLIWASYYPDDYDWDNLKTYYYPNSSQVKDENNQVMSDRYNPSFLHGTNVAGIIASSMDGMGTMGVAFSNVRIKAIRWDFISYIDEPIAKLVEDPDNVRIINLSLGQENMSESVNASTLSSLNQLAADYIAAVRTIINKNTVNSRNKIDGIIVVRAAGNEGLSNPDLESGIKRLNAETYTDNNGNTHYYRDLQMLVVAAADVNVDDNGQLVSYKISNYSNRCGATSGYCITAPGGNFVGETMTYGMFGPGQPGALTSQYDLSYYAAGGTSQAAPVVSGALAFLEGAYPYMSAEEIIELVMTTANKDKAEGGYDAAIYGAGLLDLGNAVISYVAPSGVQTASTYSGNNVYSERVSLDGATLNLPSNMRYALSKALPETITVFDRYDRPFAFSTANYVKTTHGGYKSLRNDVENIAMASKTVTERDGNFSFSFSQGSLTDSGIGSGLMDVTYTQGKNAYGFYFSENTSYKTADTRPIALKNPFMSFTNAYGVHNTYNFSRNTNLRIEAVSGRNGLYDADYDYKDPTFKKQAYALNAELNVHKSKSFALGFSTGLLYEQDALLGTNGDGAFALEGGNTYTTGVTASWFVTPKWTLSGSYYRGYTQGQKFGSDLLRTSNLTSSSFAFDVNYRQDKITDYGLKLISPLRVEKGSLFVDFPSGRDNYSDEVYRQAYRAGLKPERREFRLMGYYNKDLSENISLRTEAGVRFNPEHQSGRNDYRALFGLSWNFN